MTAPPVSFLGQLTEGFAQLLADANIGLSYTANGVYPAGQTGIYIMAVPVTPDRVVTLTPYPSGDDPTLSNSTIGLQIRSRSAGADPRDVMSIDDAVADVLLGNFPLILPTGITVTSLTRGSGVSMGQDDSKRWSWASSYHLGVHRPGLHRQ